MKLAYIYSETTGEYLGATQAQESPLEKGVYLLPANTTFTKPPFLEQQQAACFVNGKWTITGDYRGTWYKPNNETVEILELGVVPDSTWSAIELPPSNEKLNQPICAALFALDLKSIRALRDGSTDRLEAIEAEAVELRKSLLK